MPNQNQAAWNAMLGKKYQEGGNILDIVKGLENVKKQKASMAAMTAAPTQEQRHGANFKEQIKDPEFRDQYMQDVSQFAAGTIGGGDENDIKAYADKYANVVQ